MKSGIKMKRIWGAVENNSRSLEPLYLQTPFPIEVGNILSINTSSKNCFLVPNLIVFSKYEQM